MTTVGSLRGGARRRPAPLRPGAVLALGSASSFLVYLDATIVNVAFPDIRTSFAGATLSGLSWILSAYGIVFAALLVPAGRLADVVGGRRLFLAGLGAFTAGSLLCALAPGVTSLVGARVLQAAGGALLVPSAQLLIMAAFPPGQRMRVIGVMAGVAALASALGPVLGGLVVDLGGWRLVFLVNLPIGLAALALGGRMPAPAVAGGVARPDLVGSGVVIGAVGLAALGAVQGPVWGWDDPRVLGAFLGAAVLVPVLLRRCRRHPAPALALSLFKLRSFRFGNLGALLLGMSFFGLVLGQRALSHAGVGLLGADGRPGDRARAAGQRGGGGARRPLHGSHRSAPLRRAGRGGQRARGRVAGDAGRALAGVPRRVAARDAAHGHRRRARLRDDRRRLRARPRTGRARDRERNERHDAPARRGLRRRDPGGDPRPGARRRTRTTRAGGRWAGSRSPPWRRWC